MIYVEEDQKAHPSTKTPYQGPDQGLYQVDGSRGAHFRSWALPPWFIAWR